MPLRLTLPILLGLAAPAAAEPLLFTDQPIGCGSGLGFSKCHATFDGWTLTITHKMADGRTSQAIYRTCTSLPDMITCGGGTWTSGTSRGALPGRVVGLRDGKPFAQ
jgi:hypothetical protein